MDLLATRSASLDRVWVGSGYEAKGLDATHFRRPQATSRVGVLAVSWKGIRLSERLAVMQGLRSRCGQVCGQMWSNPLSSSVQVVEGIGSSGRTRTCNPPVNSRPFDHRCCQDDGDGIGLAMDDRLPNLSIHREQPGKTESSSEHEHNTDNPLPMKDL